jgi:hypothetical protein
MTESKTNTTKSDLGAGTAQAQTPAPMGKLGSLVAMLLQPEGATLDAMRAATGWQAHSVRGVIAGSIKKKLGFTVTSEKTDAGRVYRIEKGAGA